MACHHQYSADAKISVSQSGHVDKIQDPFTPVSNPLSSNGPMGAAPYAVDPGDCFLSITPALGLGELQHHRRAEFDIIE